MKLVCPHCAKVIEIADSLAGQTTSCSLCQGPLTVPFAPAAEAPPAAAPPAGPPKPPAPLPAPPPALPTPDPLGATTAWPPPPAAGSVIPPLPSAAPSSPGRGGELLGKLQNFRLPAGFEQWVGIAALGILFLLFMFPWVTVSVGDNKIVEQSGVGVGFGTSFASKEEGKFLVASLPGAGLVMIAFFCTILGVVLLAIILIEEHVTAPAIQKAKPTLQRIVALRDLVALGLLGVITLVLLLHWVVSFPLEQAAFSEKANDTMLTGLKLVTEGTIEKVKKADMVGLQWLQRRGWYTLALLISLIATGWCGTRWLASRGYTRRWPKLLLQWPNG